MKFRRRPIDRPVIDAIKLPEGYVWTDAEGTVCKMEHAEFERDYEPIVRAPRKKEAKPRKRRGQAQQPSAE